MNLHQIILLILLFIFTSCNPTNTEMSPSFLAGVSLSVKNTTISLSNSQVAVNNSISVEVQIKDDKGAAYSVDQIPISFSTDGGTSEGTFGPLQYLGGGKYVTLFTGTAPGTPTKIKGNINGQDILATPTVQVTIGSYSLLHSTLSVSSSSVQSSSNVTVTLQVNDSSGTQLQQGGLPVTFIYDGGTSTGQFSSVTDHHDGSYSVSFVGIIAGTAINIKAKIAGEVVEDPWPSVVVVPGSINHLTIVENATHQEIGAALSRITIEARDINHNKVTSHMGVVSASIADGFNPGSATLSGSVSKAFQNGEISFDDLVLSQTGTGYKLAFSDSTYSVISESFNIYAGEPSTIILAGDNSQKAGTCSGALTLTLKDSFNNTATASSALSFLIQGISEATLFSSSDCSPESEVSTISILEGYSSASFYVKSNQSGLFSLKAVRLGFVDSGIHSFFVTPSRLKLSSASTSITSTVCSGAVTVSVTDEDGNDDYPSSHKTILLSGNGVAKFYSDSNCLTPISEVNLSAIVGTASFYVKDPQGAATITITASDQISDLQTSTILFNSAAKMAFVGASQSNQSKFETTGHSAAGFEDTHFSNPRGLWIDKTNNFMYVTEDHRVKKIDLTNNQVVGWTGAVFGTAAYAPTGGVVGCAGKTSGVTNGWCNNGRSGSSSLTGGFNNAAAITGNESTQTVYILDRSNSRLIRLNGVTGQVTGWLGRVGSLPTSCDGGVVPVVGSFSTRWCIGGAASGAVSTTNSTIFPSIDGSITAGTTLGGLDFDGTYLYLASSGRIMRYVASSGEFAGWTGSIGPNQPTGTTPDNPNSCTVGSLTTTPGWCLGGDAISNNGYPISEWGNYGSLWNDGNYLYVTTNIYAGGLLRYNLLTGAFAGVGRAGDWRTVFLNFGHFSRSTNGITGHSGNLYIVNAGYWGAAISRQPVATGAINGWIGRINNQPTGGAAGCTTTSNRYFFTPGWCTGGSPGSGADNTGMMLGILDIETDGSYLYVTDADLHRIHRFSFDGTYQGWLGGRVKDNEEWSSENVASTFEGRSEFSYATPQRIALNSTHLFITDSSKNNVKKVNLKTGATEGWIGIVNQGTVSGGECVAGVSSRQATPGWCLGGITDTTKINGVSGVGSTGGDGMLQHPQGIYVDSQFLYVTDSIVNAGNINNHRVSRYDLSTGAFSGWIGEVHTTPTGPAVGLTNNCSTTSAGSSTPGWCRGGKAQRGSGSGSLHNPVAIWGDQTYLYVAESGNFRVSRFIKTSGAFAGWIGAVGTSSPTGPAAGLTNTCSSTSNGVQTTGWCSGGTSITASNSAGFSFGINDISGDEDYLYITDSFYGRLMRFNKSSGAFVSWIGRVGSISGMSCDSGAPVVGSFTPSWCSGGQLAATNNYSEFYGFGGIHVDGSFIYLTSSSGTLKSSLLKLNKSSGILEGHKGIVLTTPTGGDSGCASVLAGTIISDGLWCKWSNSFGYFNSSSVSPLLRGTVLGAFDNPSGITGNDDYLYVLDQNNGRIQRLKK
jgi:hypothetical protein